MSTSLERRNFLKNATILSTATTLAIAMPTVVTAATEQPIDEVKQTKGYHVTDHIRAYYRSLNQ